MKKISTLFKKNPENLGLVINEVNPDNKWVYVNGIATRKFDGTACAIINEELYKRYDCRIDKNTGNYKKPIPHGAISCQEADLISGHHPHWVKCNRQKPDEKYHWIAFDNLENKENGTYELCGEKVQGNPENISGYLLIKHGCEILPLTDFSFDAIKDYLSNTNIEGIVFHNNNGDMCKIRKSDFGIKRLKRLRYEKTK